MPPVLDSPQSTVKFFELPVDPFDDNIVFEPREAEPAIAGLNSLPLRRLVDQFGLLEKASPGQPPRLKAQLVTSAEPGYGKSHLIGRLFQALEQRAILVYLRPFQDPASAWRSILLKVVQELNLPEAGTSPVSPRTQLDSLAAGVVARLLLVLIGQGTLECPDAEYWVERLRTDPVGALGFAVGGADTASLSAWLEAEFEKGDLPAAIEAAASSLGMTLHAPIRRWLEVLVAYALGSGYGSERAASLEWIKGEGPGPQSAAGLAETPAASGPERNENAWRRLQDLCALAEGYRPFLLCFDQTELFTGEAALAAAFGAVIECLVSHGLNQMTVVTTNLAPWRDNILPHIQTALRARFSPPIQLQGINAAQARELARRRLEGCGVEAEEIARFLEPAWFDGLFAESPTESVRRFLDLCGKRCRQFGAASLVPAPTLEEYFRRCREGCENQAEPPGFDPDVLQWAVSPETVGETLEGVIVERVDGGFYPICWRRPSPAPEHRICFGFEDASDGRVWRSILEFLKAAVARDWTTHNVRVRYVFLRTPEQTPLPKPSWPAFSLQFDEAVASGLLTLRVLDREEVLLLHAARDLFAQALGGDAPFTRDETLAFLRTRLTPWWRRLTLTPEDRPPV